MTGWVEKLSDPKRREYYNKTIVFNCPLTKSRHKIHECLDRCDFSGYKYREHENRMAPFIYCVLDGCGERDVETGKPTRDN